MEETDPAKYLSVTLQVSFLKVEQAIVGLKPSPNYDLYEVICVPQNVKKKNNNRRLYVCAVASAIDISGRKIFQL